MEVVQCLVFLESCCGPAESHNSESTSSEESFATKMYVLFPSKLGPDHRIYENFSRAGVQIIDHDIEIPKNSRFDFCEVLVEESQRKKTGVARLVVLVKRYEFYYSFIYEVLGEHFNVLGSHYDGEILSAVDEKNLTLLEKFLRHEVNIRHCHPDGGTLLHFAVDNDHAVLIKRLLEHGADVNAKLRDKSTSLHIAVKINKPDTVKLLLENQADPNAVENNDVTPLHLAALRGSLEMVKMLVEKGAQLDARKADAATALHVAVKQEHVNVAEYLLDRGASPNVRSNMDTRYLGATPLHLAISKGSHEILSLLLEKGAYVNAECYDGRSALYLAVKLGRTEMCPFLVEHGLDANQSANKKAFQLALFKNGERYYQTVLCLLQNGFDVSAEDSRNLRVLFGAISKNLHKTVEKLLNFGASVNKFLKVGDRKWPMLQRAAACSDGEMIQLLLDHGGHINSDVRGRLPRQTPLLVAIEFSNMKTLMTLIANKANFRDSVVHAVDRKCFEVLLLLLENGADVNSPDSEGRTPILAAAFNDGGSRETIDILVKFGARCYFGDITSFLSAPEYPSIPQNNNFQVLLDYSFTNFDPAIKESIQKFFQHPDIVVNYSNVRKYAKQLALFVIKIEAAFGSDGPEIPAELKRVSRLNSFKLQCEEEIDRMKLEIIAPTDLSFHDVLTKQMHQVSRYARDEKILQALAAFKAEGKFPIYASILKSQIRKGIWRRHILKLGIKLSKFLFSGFSSLPDDMKEKVVDFLSNQDVLILQKCLNANSL